MATLVKFLIDKDGSDKDIFAYFPKLKHAFDFNIAYSHVRQHSPCHRGYVKECTKATPAQYAGLKAELESIGYNLKVCK